MSTAMWISPCHHRILWSCSVISITCHHIHLFMCLLPIRNQEDIKVRGQDACTRSVAQHLTGTRKCLLNKYMSKWKNEPGQVTLSPQVRAPWFPQPLTACIGLWFADKNLYICFSWQRARSQSSCPGPNLAPVQTCDLNVDGCYGLNVSLPQIHYVGSPNPQHLRI